MEDRITVTESAEVPGGTYWAKLINQEKYDSHWSPARRVYFELDPKYKINGHVNGIFPEMATAGNKTGVLIRACFGECNVGGNYSWGEMIGNCMYIKVEQTAKPEGLFSKVTNVVWPPPRDAMNQPQPNKEPEPKPEFQQPTTQEDGGDDVPF